MSTLKTTNLQNASASSPAFVLAADGSATANLSSVNGGAIAGSRNRIINGDMRIDQRAAAVTTSAYSVDRWAFSAVQNNKATVQQSTIAPTSFSRSLGATSSSAYSVLAGDYFTLSQSVEGLNAADLNWGTANAQTVTLSFWVRSSLTGIFGGSLLNNSATRSYAFSYTITSANTWEQKTVTIPGDTTGTWASDNSVGVYVFFSLGTGSSFSGTAGSWNSSNLRSATGATSVVGTNGATFYITGVQLEPGTVATPFERRSYGQELALCQRYYQKSYRPLVAPGTNTFEGMEWVNGATARMANTTRFAVQLRTAPGVVTYDSVGTANRVRTSAGDGQTGYVIRGPSENNFTVDYTSGGINELLYHWTASAEI